VILRLVGGGRGIPLPPPAGRGQLLISSGTLDFPRPAAIAPFIGGPCRIQDADPGEFGDRVVERRQEGVKLRDLVCDGDLLDCPPDAVCSERLDRCVSE
jgi:hypothetical protein